jgi:hypothetical protein
MSDVQYVTSFRKLNLSDEITGHVELIPGVNITNDARVMSSLLTPELASVAGAIEIEYLRRAPNLVFGEFDAEQFRELPPDGVWFPILMWIDGLFRNAWLLKDHALELGDHITKIALVEQFCVTNLVKDRAFALELLAEHLLKLRRRNSLETSVQGFDDNDASIITIASNEHFGVTAGANPTSNVVPILEDRSLQIQFKHCPYCLD